MHTLPYHKELIIITIILALFLAVPLLLGSFIFVALLFYDLWLKSIVPAIVNDSVPPEVTNNDFLVNPIHVIDLAFVLPGMILGSILLWRRQGMGYVIASVSMVFMVFLTIALAAMVVMLALRDVSEDNTIALVFGILSVLSLLFSIVLFRKIKT